MTVDPAVLVGLIMNYLRRVTLLGRVQTDDLWSVVELVDKMLRHLGIESEPHASSGLLLSVIAAAPNARARGYREIPRRVRPHPAAHRCAARADSRRPAGRPR